MSCDLPPGLDGNWLRRNYLFGINLTNDQGRPYPEELYVNQIRAAVSRAETLFGIAVSPRAVTADLYDVQLTHAPRYQLRLVTRPVRRITRWAMRSGLNPSQTYEVDPSLVLIRSKLAGEVELRVHGVIPGLWNGVRWFPSFIGFHHGAAPAQIEVDYLAGFDGNEFALDPTMKDWIGLTAAMLPLDTAGDLIAGAGIASKSIGQDGLSQSLSTTASATNAGYGARILSYQKRLPTIEADLRAKYRGVAGFSAI